MPNEVTVTVRCHVRSEYWLLAAMMTWDMLTFGLLDVPTWLVLLFLRIEVG